VIVKDNHILSTGYNGAMPGAPHCIDQPDQDGEPYCFRRAHGIPDIDKYNFCKASHAEANAIAQAARYGTAINGATLYATLAPCFICLKLIATARIQAVYYEHTYESLTPERDAFWQTAVRESGLETYEQLIISPRPTVYFVGYSQHHLPAPHCSDRVHPEGARGCDHQEVKFCDGEHLF
jgi:dCMP deaminase